MATPEVKKYSGTTSTFIPGGKGTSGTRAHVTFYGSSSMNVNTEQYSLKFKLNETTREIQNQYGNEITPEDKDFILFADTNKTYLLNISGKDTSSGAYITEILDEWDVQTQQSTEQQIDISSISLNVVCKPSTNQSYLGFKKEIAYTKQSENDGIISASYIGDFNPTVLQMHSSCAFNFTITSLNSIPLNHYKLQIEFITDWSSPAMDTRIAKKFITPKIYSGLNDEYNTSVEQHRTFRGYFSNYSCKGVQFNNAYDNVCSMCGSVADFVMIQGRLVKSCDTCGNNIILTSGETNVNPEIASENFDDEKLDNFVVTIKDYNDGIGELTYNSTIYIPKDVIINAYNQNKQYSCNLYLYVNGINGTKEKIWMRNLTSYINSEIINSDNDVYDDYNNTDTDLIIPIIPPSDPVIPPVIETRYAGTAHSGQDTNIIYLGNTDDLTLPREMVVDDTDEYSTHLQITSFTEYYDAVYVNNLNVQTLAGTGSWCQCTYDRANNRVKYKALSNNTTSFTRYAYFVHSTQDETLSYGPNVGERSQFQWTVTVAQTPKLVNSGSGSNFEQIQENIR